MKAPKFLSKIPFIGGKKKSVTMVNFQRINGLEDFYDSLNLRTFRESLYLFIGVSMIRETVSSIPLEMYEIVNKNGDVNEVTDDPFLDILHTPNNRQTQKEFWKLGVAYYLLAGETFWYLERENENDIPTQIVNMRPDAVEILLSVDKTDIVAYQYTREDGQVIKLAPFQVLHIKNIDPVNTLRGIGTIRPASQRIITEKEASKYQSETFRKQGRPDIAVFMDDEVTDEKVEDATARWERAFADRSRGSNVAFLGDKAKSLQVLGTNPKEMDFIQTQAFLRDDILASLRIPKAMITSDDVNLANSKTARINYIKEACQPVLDAFVDVINNRLLATMDNGRFVTYESPAQEDREIVLKEATDLKQAGIITVNEARDLMHYTPIDGEDTLSTSSPLSLTMSMKMIRIRKMAKGILKRRKVLARKFAAVDALAQLYRAQAAEKAVKREKNPVFNTPELKAWYIKTFNDNIDRKSKLFLDTVNVYNEGFAKRIVEHMEKFGPNPTSFFDVTTELVTAKGIFTPLMKNMFMKAGQETLDTVASGFSQKAAESFYTPEEYLKQLEHRAEFFIKSMLNTDYEELKQIIVQNLNDGKGVSEIGQAIRLYFTDMSVARAKTIARTETGRLVSQATNEAYNQSAFVTGKEWMTAGDDRVREEHQINNGVVVANGDAFPDGEHYPGESSINCRCALAPAI